jgi:muconolactone delta-isomerase
MYDKNLARSILETLEQAFPERLHLHDLKVALPDFEAAPTRDWLSAIQALRLDGKLDGVFLPDGTSIADAAALYITERGRLQLREPEVVRMETKSGLKVFICHSSGDKERVRTLYGKLKRDGFTPWLDQENILPGQEWDSEIRKAVRTSDVVVVCLSESSITKEGYVQKEIKLALDVAEEKPEGTIFLIPARFEDCQVPHRLVGWQWVDLFEARGYERVVAALRARWEQIHGRPGASGTSRSTAQPRKEEKREAPLSLAEKMKRALAEHVGAEEAARSKQQRQGELREAARKAGPTQFNTLAALLRAKGDVMNNESLSGFPNFKFVPVNHRLDAGKYTIELSPYEALDSYSVTIRAGLHPNAAQFMVEVPDIPTREHRLIASMDQDGFSWRDPAGRQCDVNQLLDRAMETVCDLILEDIRHR